MNTWDFVPEFMEALATRLKEDEKRWHDTWLKRNRKDQDRRMIRDTLKRFSAHLDTNEPLDNLAIAGDALIDWVRTRHPEIWPE